ncbi:MAG TPA: hypothetical protein VK675_01720 [Candidatus Paceibacterota bacterium]|nr:hypothetical protein [Candidatus Paceibacterota bacterium]
MEKEPSFTNRENQAETLEPVLASIMTAEEYSHTEHVTPYIFELQAGDKKLRYFGSPHVRDPQNPLFAEIETAFNEVNPDIVFMEGVSIHGDKTDFDERVKAASREEAIELMGESGFTLKLCAEKGIEWRSPEPTDTDLYNDLLAKGFSKEQIFAWDVFHILPQYNRLTDKKGFKPYVQGFVERFKQATNWEGFDYSYERAIQLGEQLLGRYIDVENEPDASDFIDPIPWEEKKGKQTILNRIGETSSLFRDRKIVSDIANALETHKRIFVVYGASHAAMQEPALRKLLERK